MSSCSGPVPGAVVPLGLEAVVPLEGAVVSAPSAPFLPCLLAVEVSSSRGVGGSYLRIQRVSA